MIDVVGTLTKAEIMVPQPQCWLRVARVPIVLFRKASQDTVFLKLRAERRESRKALKGG